MLSKPGITDLDGIQMPASRPAGQNGYGDLHGIGRCTLNDRVFLVNPVCHTLGGLNVPVGVIVLELTTRGIGIPINSVGSIKL